MARGYRIIALTAELRSIDSNSLPRLLKMVAEILKVLRSTGQAVDSNDYYGWLRAIRGEPFLKWEMRTVERRVELRRKIGFFWIGNLVTGSPVTWLRVSTASGDDESGQQNTQR